MERRTKLKYFFKKIAGHELFDFVTRLTNILVYYYIYENLPLNKLFYSYFFLFIYTKGKKKNPILVLF